MRIWLTFSSVNLKKIGMSSNVSLTLLRTKFMRNYMAVVIITFEIHQLILLLISLPSMKNYYSKQWKTLLPKESNTTVHHLQFRSIVQSDGESTKDYVVCLKSIILDYQYVCPNCQHSLSTIHLKNQLIRSMQIESLQTDILAKTNYWHGYRMLLNMPKHLKQVNQTRLQSHPDALTALSLTIKVIKVTLLWMWQPLSWSKGSKQLRKEMPCLGETVSKM